MESIFRDLLLQEKESNQRITGASLSLYCRSTVAPLSLFCRSGANEHRGYTLESAWLLRKKADFAVLKTPL